MCDWGTAITAGISLIGMMQDDPGADAAEVGAGIQAAQFRTELPLKQRQVQAGIKAIDRGEKLAEAELPLQLTVIDEAALAGTEEQQGAAAARATTDVNAALEAQESGRTRQLRALGIDPGSPAALAGDRTARAMDAATLAKAATDAREMEKRRGEEQRIRVAGQSRGFNPNVSTVTDPGAALVQSGATLSKVHAADQAARQEQMRTIGQAAGQAVTRYNTPQTSYVGNTGGGAGSPYDTNFDTYRGSQDIMLAEGGEIDGPSHAEGGVPIEVEGGEYVIKADSAQKYGPRLLREVNEGTAIIIPTASPRRLKAVA